MMGNRRRGTMSSCYASSSEKKIIPPTLSWGLKTLLSSRVPNSYGSNSILWTFKESNYIVVFGGYEFHLKDLDERQDSSGNRKKIMKKTSVQVKYTRSLLGSYNISYRLYYWNFLAVFPLSPTGLWVLQGKNLMFCKLSYLTVKYHCDRQNTSLPRPKYIHTLIPKTFECVTWWKGLCRWN